MDTLQFILLDVSAPLIVEWKRAISEHVPERFQRNFTTVLSTLEDLQPPHNQFDCIVSPANSYGILDGGFDLVLAKAISPNNARAPTLIAQQTLYQVWKGYAPTGTCTIVPLKNSVCEDNPHGCLFIALCPTMRTPEKIVWNREIVYNCMWSLLVALEKHNQAAAVDHGTVIRKVLMTGLGTGTGGISAERCAKQMALAIRDFIDASENAEKWRTMEWNDAYEYSQDIRRQR